MTASYIIAIDQGTTGTTMLVLDRAGQIAHKYYCPLPQSYPEPGWVEHDPELIRETVWNGLREIMALPWLKEGAVAAIGLTNQRETIVMWERDTGRPVYPAIVWQCRRTAEACARLEREDHGATIRAKTGLRLDPYFSATKLQWLLENRPGLRERAERGELACGTVDSWLIWQLTGGRVHATDYSNASRTLLFNIHELRWDPELLELFGVPASLLPEVRPSAGDFGWTDPRWTGVSLPITGVLGDQQAALFGQGCLQPGMMKNTYGTGCFLLMNTGTAPSPPQHGMLATIAWGLGGQVTYALEGSVFNGGTVVQWLRDELGLLQRAADSQTLALSVPDSGGVYFVPAFTGSGAPYWDPYARGTIVGLTRGTTRAQLVRAALEGIAYQVLEVVECMSLSVGRKPAELRVDGGAAANDFLLQFQADICDLGIRRNRSLELTGTGAAFIAGLAVGFWNDPGELAGLVTLERDFQPAMAGTERERLVAGWRRAVERSGGWAGA
ncbi:glycerol kinase [Hydrogenispora ethanolica]|uniref:Glycerol kinase n=1 Tax=Hydrogenispora ethanolica TaxID=1082276 RepID=A0A4R1S094_HYDET|nr:glycerol kinase GlpK [Hydrogenispora ethanolica]TCL72329.1 glycerol kinase [Hydrogenispora ethanolica]